MLKFLNNFFIKLVFIIAFCFSSFSLTLADEPIDVVATFSIIGDMVERVGGEYVKVNSLVGTNSDSHVYRPTPNDAKALHEADILFINGLSFETWIERLVEASDFESDLVVLTDGIEPIAYEGEHSNHSDEYDEHEHHDGHKDKHDEHEHHDGHKDEHDHHDEHKHDDGHKDKHDEHEHHDGHKDEHDHHDEHKHDDGHKDKHDEHEHHDGHKDEHDHHDEHKHDDGHKDKHDEHEHHDGHKDEHDHHDGHDHGIYDPHAWLSPVLGIIYIDNITSALIEALPSQSEYFSTNRNEYVDELMTLHSEISQMMDSLPINKRTVVTSHDAFQYFGREYELIFVAPQGLSTDSEASAQQVVSLINQIKSENISAVFVENIADSRLIAQIAEETDASIGGTLYPGTLSEKNGPASTYLDLLRHNASTIVESLNN